MRNPVDEFQHQMHTVAGVIIGVFLLVVAMVLFCWLVAVAKRPPKRPLSDHDLAGDSCLPWLNGSQVSAPQATHTNTAGVVWFAIYSSTNVAGPYTFRDWSRRGEIWTDTTNSAEFFQVR